MRLDLKTLVGCWLLAAAVKVSALDCRRAVTPIEKALCSNAELAHVDADMNELYGKVQGSLAPKAKAELLSQQRAWLAQRNRVCADGNEDCLRKQYGGRMDTLAALYAATDVIPNALDNLHPLVVQGSWKATSVRDPEGATQGSNTDTHQSISQADLPALGSLVEATPGKVCVEHGCRTMAWKRTTMARVDGGDVMGPAVGLSLSAQVLVGDPGTKNSPSLLLAARDHGEVWAIFGLCKANGMDCHNAVEVWTPVGQAAIIGPLP